MKPLTQLLLTAISASWAIDADACSCALPHGTEHEQIATAYGYSENVFVAKVVTARISPDPEDPSGHDSTEDAIFEVVEVLKGNFKIGDSIRIQSSIGPGSCGISSRNNPVWLLQAERIDSKVKETALLFSPEWLIYSDGDGSEPIELSMCGRSFPLHVQVGNRSIFARSGENDLIFLRSFIKKHVLR